MTDPAKPHSAVHLAIGTVLEVVRGHQIVPVQGHEKEFSQHFGTSSSVVMMRPDGYVAFTGTENSIPDLGKYCDRWLIGQPMPVVKQASDA